MNEIGPGHGYLPQGSKSCLLVHPDDETDANAVFRDTGVQIVTGHRFLGGFVGTEEGKLRYLEQKIDGWMSSVKKLAVAGESHPQSAYGAFTKSLQNRWSFVQRVVDCADGVYDPLRHCIRSDFVPMIVGEPSATSVSSEENDLFSLPVRKGGLAIIDPVRSAKLSFETSRAGSEELVRAITSGGELDMAEHLTKSFNAKQEARKKRQELDDALLDRTLALFPFGRRRAIERSVNSKSGGWLSVMPLTKHDFDLSPYEFRDAIAIRYKRQPIKMPRACDGCGHNHFTLEHALDCKTGGLVTRRHNEVRDVLGDLMATAWGNCVKEPIIREASNSLPALRGDLACRGVWEPQREALFDVRVVDTDAPSYGSRAVSAVLCRAEQEKMNKYISAAEDRHATFTPLVCSADGVLAPQMDVFVKVLGERLADKWHRAQSDVRGWLRARISLAIVRASSMCLRGTRKRWRSGELGFGDGAAVTLGV